MRLHPDSVPDSLEGGIVYDPVPQLYNEAQIIFDGVHYFNDRVSSDLISIATHFNPYQVPLTKVDKIPMQQSAYEDWRAHLEGARRIVQIRGGLKEIIRTNTYIKPLLAFFIAIDVMAATTAPSTHRCMYSATTMALHYWEIEPGIFQSNLAISMPCPEELFQVLILVNYLRAISSKKNLTSRRHAGTRMVLEKLQSFSAVQWAMKMKGFRGWKPSGDGVDFDTTASEHGETSSPPTAKGPRSQGTTPISSKPSPTLKREASDTPEPTAQITDLWLNIGIVYRSAVLLYAIRTLIADLSEDKDILFTKDSPHLNLEALCLEHRRALVECLTPIFSDATNAHQFGKLVYFPMFVCGMELGSADKEVQDFVAQGLETVGTACGTLGPISAADELRGYWAASAEKGEGEHVTWDEWFEGKPDFIFGF
ncbi:putative Fungal-specific transcription factor domain-containing protein [Seiridium unicorne]|uniref:Fungal-specific transcription factor domain-containing protein n=1 Tax=Seiridium unicorne TaxID=138068 RepID=A0ABR2UYL0_9PEZI